MGWGYGPPLSISRITLTILAKAVRVLRVFDAAWIVVLVLVGATCGLGLELGFRAPLSMSHIPLDIVAKAVRVFGSC